MLQNTTENYKRKSLPTYYVDFIIKSTKDYVNAYM